MDMNPIADANSGDPKKVMRAIAGKLAAAGFGVGYPDGRDGRYLAITSAGRGHGTLAMEDDGLARWEYRPELPAGTGPAGMTGLVMRVLGAGNPGRIKPYPADPGVTFKGLVGRALEDRGLNVALEVFDDPHWFDMWAEIAVTNPGRPDRGKARVSDEATMTWISDHGHACPDTGKLTDTIAGIITDGMGGLEGLLTGLPVILPVP